MRPPNTARREEIRKLLATGMTQTAVAEKLGLSQTLVSYYARGLGIRRGKGTRTDLKRGMSADDFTTEIQRLAVEYARPIIMREIVNAAGAQLWR